MYFLIQASLELNMKKILTTLMMKSKLKIQKIIILKNTNNHILKDLSKFSNQGSAQISKVIVFNKYLETKN